MRKIVIILLIFVSPFSTLLSQTVNGVVYSKSIKNDTKTPLPYAFIYWLESRNYIEADEKGRFSFTFTGNSEATLVATSIGYTNDTLVINKSTKDMEFVLIGLNELEQATVMAKQEANYLSKVAPVRTEVITAAGLCKMACCNLAESFENSASVTVGYSDAITGAKQIRLLGLSGIYTQMLDENRPVMRGLASPFGLSYVPGQWLESIQIAKGPSSVINGSEAITGQINLEHRKPTTEQPLFLNLFLSDMLRTEANIASSIQMGTKWSTVLLGHFSTDPTSHDANEDGFRDEPQTLQFNVSNRWLYAADNGLQLRFGFRALSDDRLGGEMKFTKSITRRSVERPWGSNIKNKGINGYVKLGIPLNFDNSKNIALVADYTYHQIDSYYGLKDYNGDQNSLFANLMYQSIPNDSHRMTFGISTQIDRFNETLYDWSPWMNIVDLKDRVPHDLSRNESSIGAFGEYTYTHGEKFTGVIDFRADYNNIHGWLLAPRANIKYAFTDNLILRASAGKGYRSPNVIVDNMGMLSTSRTIHIEDDLDIEEAWTYGGNITAYLNAGYENSSYLSFDFFRTDFQKQLIVDQERDLSRFWLYNLDGPSYTNTYQADFSIDPFKGFNILATFRYTDAKVTMHGKGLVERPLSSKYKGVLNLQYATRMNLWVFDFTAQINGPTKLPDFMPDEYSPAYPMLYAQITRKIKAVEIYAGVENITNYKQPNPIISADNPYAPDFNSTVIWGPLMNRKFYIGMRLTIWK